MTRPRQGRSVVLDIAGVARRIVEAHAGLAWPAEKWQGDILGFCDSILGVRLWSAQEEILAAIQNDSRVAVAGGRKIGKDFALACAAIWFYASFHDARVFMTANSSKQIDDVLYRQIRRLMGETGKCLECKRLDRERRERGERPMPVPCPHSAVVSGQIGMLARTGVVATDMREMKGYTSDQPEGLAGLSGQNILAIIDEASAYPDPMHIAIRGNLAGSGCKEVLISNPTRNKGFFFDAFHKARGSYATIQVSSETTPNVLNDNDEFPGLATRRWLREQANDWGDESRDYAIHCKGEFVLSEQGAIFPVHALIEAQERWATMKPEGVLAIGVDPAGPSERGDESAFAARRGKKILSIHTRRALTPEAHLIEVLGLIASHGSGPDRATVLVDREGETGNRVWGTFIAHLQGHDGAFDLIGVRSSERARRLPLTYDRVRDELFASLAEWIRDGGAIPEDGKLRGELGAFRWVDHISGRTKAVPKDKIREELGRSPDRADAVALACWSASVIGATAVEPAHSAPPDAYEARPDQTFDPYAGVERWR